jgi:hypothetical protein
MNSFKTASSSLDEQCAVQNAKEQLHEEEILVTEQKLAAPDPIYS